MADMYEIQKRRCAKKVRHGTPSKDITILYIRVNGCQVMHIATTQDFSLLIEPTNN